MNFKATCSRVLLVTDLTDKGPLARVCQLVCLQVTLSDKLLAAKFTPEWSFTWVGPHMRFKIPSFAELF